MSLKNILFLVQLIIWELLAVVLLINVILAEVREPVDDAYQLGLVNQMFSILKIRPPYDCASILFF